MPTVETEDLERDAREFLQSICDDEYDGNIAAMASAIEVSRSTLHKVLSGERGLNNIGEWSVRLAKIGYSLRDAFRAREPMATLPSRAGRLVARMPEHLQAATVSYLEHHLAALDEAAASPKLGPEAEQLLREFESMDEEGRRAVIHASTIYSGKLR